MTDQEHADRLHAAARELTQAMNDAMDDGLLVQVPEWVDMNSVTGAVVRRLLCSFRVSRPIDPGKKDGFQ